MRLGWARATALPRGGTARAHLISRRRFRGLQLVPSWRVSVARGAPGRPRSAAGYVKARREVGVLAPWRASMWCLGLRVSWRAARRVKLTWGLGSMAVG